MNTTELLCPAGSYEKLEYAYAFGADACYLGLPIFSLRARENEFDILEIQKAMALAKSLNKKIYLTLNVFARNIKIPRFRAFLPTLEQLRPDALIMSDPGLILMTRERLPEIPIHLSVQANCMNAESARFWQGVGIKRVILSRELKIDEIKAIHSHLPDLELEAFVHGSMCIAYSGRCLMSQYMSSRDANQGLCDNSCRYPYKIYESKKEVHLLEDLRSPGDYYPIEEDENGTYLMNSKDLCLVNHLQDLRDAGVCSFKIEGRSKSLHYVSVVTKSYKSALNQSLNHRPVSKSILDDLKTLTTRGYTTGFMFPTQESTQAYNFKEQLPPKKFVGVFNKTTGINNTGLLEVKGQIQTGKTYEVYDPEQSRRVEIRKIKRPNGETIETAHPGIGQVEIEVPFNLHKYSLLREVVS